MKYYLYVLKSQKGSKYYVGISKNLKRRLAYHNTLEKGFTSRYRSWSLVFEKSYANKTLAAEAERTNKYSC